MRYAKTRHAYADGFTAFTARSASRLAAFIGFVVAH